MKKYIFIVISAIFLGIAISGSEIYLADLYVYSEIGLEITKDEKNCTDFLYEYLSGYDFNKKLGYLHFLITLKSSFSQLIFTNHFSNPLSLSINVS